LTFAAPELVRRDVALVIQAGRGADRLILPDLPLAGLEHFSRRMTPRKPAALARIKDPHRTIEVACFLRLTTLRVTDASLTLLDHRIAALWRAARECAEEARASRLLRFRALLGDLPGWRGTKRSTPPRCDRG
jgi:hypothetical protein